MEKTNEMGGQLSVSVDQFSRLTSLSKAFIRNEIRKGKLKIRRCGHRRIVILRTDAIDYLNKSEEFTK